MVSGTSVCSNLVKRAFANTFDDINFATRRPVRTYTAEKVLACKLNEMHEFVFDVKTRTERSCNKVKSGPNE